MNTVSAGLEAQIERGRLGLGPVPDGLSQSERQVEAAILGGSARKVAEALARNPERAASRLFHSQIAWCLLLDGLTSTADALMASKPDACYASSTVSAFSRMTDHVLRPVSTGEPEDPLALILAALTETDLSKMQLLFDRCQGLSSDLKSKPATMLAMARYCAAVGDTSFMTEAWLEDHGLLRLGCWKYFTLLQRNGLADKFLDSLVAGEGHAKCSALAVKHYFWSRPVSIGSFYCRSRRAGHKLVKFLRE